MFVEKSNEELAAMSVDNLRAYYMEKLSHEKTEIKSINFLFFLALPSN